LNEIDKVSLETLKRLVRGKMVCGAKTMTVHAHNKVLFEIADYVEKLQNHLFRSCAYVDWKGEPAFLCTTCQFNHGFKQGCAWKKERELLGLEKETSK